MKTHATPMKRILSILALALTISACASSAYQPDTVGQLSCDEVRTGLSELARERQAISIGALLGGIAIALSAGPWVAVPVLLAPGARGDRGEFALGVIEVVKGC